MGWRTYAEGFRLAIFSTQDPHGRHEFYAEQSLPDYQILGILWSRALSNDGSLLGLFNPTALQDLKPYPAALPISSHLTVSDPQLLAVAFDILPLPYICSRRSRFDKPARKIETWPRDHEGGRLLLPKQLVIFEQTLWRLVLVIIQSSWMNLFDVTKSMGAGGLVECVLDRLHPPTSHLIAQKLEARRSSLDKRVRWSYDAAQDPFAVGVGSRAGAAASEKQTAFLPAADGNSKTILLKVLRRLLEAGVHPRLSFRLFKLLRRENVTLTQRTGRLPVKSGRDSSGTSTPSTSASPSGHIKTRSRKLDQPFLQIDLNGLSMGGSKADQLDNEMLEAVSHGMGKRWPDLFGFKGPGGCLTLNGVQQWPTKERGFYFMVSRSCAAS